jgi:GDP-L-fucose synthase
LQFVNVGVGKETTISQLAQTVSEIVGFKGKVEYDPTKPDGMPLKRLDVARLSAMGWKAKTPLREGLRKAYLDFFQTNAVRER